MSAVNKDPFPKSALIAASALVGFALVATTVGRVARLSAPAPSAEQAEPAPSRSVELRFTDEADGSVTVRESPGGRMVASLAPGTNGFIRGVMRGLARERRGLDIGAGPPFRLSSWPDGRLAIDDTATGRRIELDAFGSTNKTAFLTLLDGEAQRP